MFLNKDIENDKTYFDNPTIIKSSIDRLNDKLGSKKAWNVKMTDEEWIEKKNNSYRTPDKESPFSAVRETFIKLRNKYALLEKFEDNNINIEFPSLNNGTTISNNDDNTKIKFSDMLSNNKNLDNNLAVSDGKMILDYEKILGILNESKFMKMYEEYLRLQLTLDNSDNNLKSIDIKTSKILDLKRMLMIITVSKLLIENINNDSDIDSITDTIKLFDILDYDENKIEIINSIIECVGTDFDPIHYSHNEKIINKIESIINNLLESYEPDEINCDYVVTLFNSLSKPMILNAINAWTYISTNDIDPTTKINNNKLSINYDKKAPINTDEYNFIHIYNISKKNIKQFIIYFQLDESFKFEGESISISVINADPNIKIMSSTIRNVDYVINTIGWHIPEFTYNQRNKEYWLKKISNKNYYIPNLRSNRSVSNENIVKKLFSKLCSKSGGTINENDYGSFSNFIYKHSKK